MVRWSIPADWRARVIRNLSSTPEQFRLRRGKGIGTSLVKHALERCVAAAELVGGRALMVNALDGEAAGFWRRRGFLPSKDDPFILYRSIADIAASLAQAGR